MFRKQVNRAAMTLLLAGSIFAAGAVCVSAEEAQPEKHIKIYTNLSEANTTYWVWDDILHAYQDEVYPNFSWEVEVVPDHD